jgi:hypothetical protein
MNVSDMISRYAFLMAGIEYGAARGQQAPISVMDEANRLYARASAMLSPQEQQMALRAVDSMKGQYLEQRMTQDAMAEARDAGYYRDKITKEATGGLSPDQLAAAIRGEPYAVKGSKPALDPDGANEAAKRMGSYLGADLDLKKLTRISEAISEKRAVGRSDKDINKYLESKFPGKAADALKMIDSFQDSGAELMLGLQECRGDVAEPDYVVEPDSDTQLRAQIADAWAKDVAEDPKALAEIASGGISDEYMESDFRHGDIARAMRDAELAEEKAEREAYQPPTYNVEEQANGTY